MRDSVCIVPCILAGIAALGLGIHEARAQWQPLGEPGSGGRITGISISPHDADRVLIGGDILGIGLSIDGGDNWLPSLGLLNYEIEGFTWHPTDANTVWAGTNGGPYVSTDGGTNWSPSRGGAMPPLSSDIYTAPVQQVLFDPNDANRLLAIGGSARARGGLTRQIGNPNLNAEFGAVWESLNGGDTWSRLSTVTPTGSALGDAASEVNLVSAAFAAGSSTTVYATGRGDGFYRSVDGGASWTLSNDGLPHTEVNAVAVHPTEANTVFVALGSRLIDAANDVFDVGGLYRSTDGGQNWSAVNNGLGQNTGPAFGNVSRYLSVVVAPSDGDVVYTADDRFGTQHAVARSDNGGDSFTSLLTASGVTRFPQGGVEVEVLAVDPNNADRVFGGTASIVIRSEDGGATFEDVTAERVGPGGQGSDAFRGVGYTGWVATGIEFNPNNVKHVILQGFDAARVMQTLDGGRSYTREATETSPFGGGNDAVFAGSTIYATLGQPSVGFQGLARSTDSGQTWDALFGGGLPELGASVNVPRGIYAAAATPERVFVSVDETLYESIDGGETFATRSLTLTDATGAATGDATRVRWIQEDRNTPTTFYVSTEEAVFRTSDAGDSFQSISGPGKPGKLDVDSTGNVYLAAFDGSGNPGDGLFRFDVQTEQWTQLFADPQVVDVSVDPNDPSRIAVVTADPPLRDVSRASGVYLSTNGGLSFEPLNENLPQKKGNVIQFNPANSDELLVGTGGRGFFRIRLDDLPGDFNDDGSVDAIDYAVWRDSLGVFGFGLSADHDASGVVDAGDYQLWVSNFGATAGVVAVPEPVVGWAPALGLLMTRSRRPSRQR